MIATKREGTSADKPLVITSLIEIKIAEQDNEVGNAMMAKLGKEFDSNYRPTSTASDLHD